MTESSVATTGASLPESDPSARITRIQTPIASPGSCVICGKSDHPDGFAATDNLDFEFYGTVYFCGDCVGDYARVFGFISPNELVQLRLHAAAQDAELNTLRQAVLGLESTVDGLVGDAHRRTEQRANVIAESKRNNDPKRPVDESDARPADVSTTEPVGEPKRDKPEPARPVDVEGRDNVLDTNSADELLGLS